ncbi:MAG: hypothetical protein WCI02_13745, partial [Planctomycetota bacterium]
MLNRSSLIRAFSVLFMAYILGGEGVLAQALKIEEKVPKSLEYDEEVLVAVERLRNLRISESRLGEA